MSTHTWIVDWNDGLPSSCRVSPEESAVLTLLAQSYLGTDVDVRERRPGEDARIDPPDYDGVLTERLDSASAYAWGWGGR